MTDRSYRILSDCPAVYDFLSEIGRVDRANGFPAPFFEYAQSHSMFDMAQSHRIRLWEEDGVMIGMAFYEMQIGQAMFALRPGFERIVGAMVDYAERRLCAEDGSLQVWTVSGQSALREELTKREYAVTGTWNEAVYDMSKGRLMRSLPEGFSFVPVAECDTKRLNECLFRGFDHEGVPEKGAEEAQLHMSAAPHARPELSVLVAAPEGEYCCFAGMWIDVRSRLMYLEPLCVVPEYRRKGVAAAAISELQRRCAAYHPAYMTGGSNPLYYALGFETAFTNELWEKKKA